MKLGGTPLFICYMPLSHKTGDKGSLIGQKGDLGVNQLTYYCLPEELKGVYYEEAFIITNYITCIQHSY